MTKEEAVEILCNAAWLGTNEQREQIEQAVHIAVRALGIVKRLTYCKDCEKHNKRIGIDVTYMEDACPLIEFRGKPQDHEFDYQYCCYGRSKVK